MIKDTIDNLEMFKLKVAYTNGNLFEYLDGLSIDKQMSINNAVFSDDDFDKEESKFREDIFKAIAKLVRKHNSTSLDYINSSNGSRTYVRL